MKRDKYICQDCRKAGKVKAAEEVHHIIELTPDNINDPAITLALDNLISLCRKCHGARHGTPYERRYTVDAAGRVKIL